MLPGLKAASNDKTVECRKASYLVISQLLNKLPGSVLPDYEPELLCYLLNGLSDDSQEVIAMTKELISEVGRNVRKMHMELEAIRDGDITMNTTATSV